VNIADCDYVGCVKESDEWRDMSRRMRRMLSLVLLVALLLTTCWVDQADTIRWL